MPNFYVLTGLRVLAGPGNSEFNVHGEVIQVRRSCLCDVNEIRR